MLRRKMLAFIGRGISREIRTCRSSLVVTSSLFRPGSRLSDEMANSGARHEMGNILPMNWWPTCLPASVGTRDGPGSDPSVDSFHLNMKTTHLMRYLTAMPNITFETFRFK